MSEPNPVTVGTPDYADKQKGYFAGCRADYVNALPDDAKAAILEIGCAEGATGALALQSGKCGRYVGVELNAQAADIARSRLSEVVVGNVESIELDFPPNSFDALIISEVLEHLVDPAAVLAKLRPYLKPGAKLFASSPNVSHHRVIRELVRGRWELTDRGVMDSTHLRWFTPSSYRALIEDAGFSVLKVAPVRPFSAKQRLINAATAGRFSHLLMTQISIFAVKREK
ncbi:MAG: class I SAM-dependent methyltransferase [Parasphingorhabdus sp.]|nr:class I SAM-dependent methyltransferase [Parasphingorhabdus sp.]